MWLHFVLKINIIDKVKDKYVWCLNVTYNDNDFKMIKKETSKQNFNLSSDYKSHTLRVPSRLAQ